MPIQAFNPDHTLAKSGLAENFDLQDLPSVSKPVEVTCRNTGFLTTEEYTQTRTLQRPQKTYRAPLPPHSATTAAGPDASPIQIWEGRVLNVDVPSNVMTVLLTAKMGQFHDHTADIELQWVSEQDRDLVQPGAVFYLSLFKQMKRGSVQNSQELRFRRLPAWTRKQLENIQVNAAMIRSKMRARPLSE